MSDTLGLSTDYGLTVSGFVRKRFPEIRADIITALQHNLGLDLDTDPSSFTGQFIDTFAEQIAIAWERTELVYLAMYPESAQGTALDMAVSFTGNRRLQARRGSVWATLRGNPGAFIGTDFQARILGDKVNLFNLFTDITLTPSNASWVQYNVTANSASIRIDGVTYSSAPSLSSPGAAATSLAGVIGAVTGLDASATGSTITMKATTDRNLVFDNESNLNVLKVGTAGEFRSTNFATFDIAVGAFTDIVTPTTGVDSVVNASSGSPGRTRESDAALRERYRTGVYRLGAGTVPALRAILEQTIGVQQVRIFENVTNATDSDSRPAHSFEVVIIGGTDADVAEEIFANKPIGIATYGLSTVAIVDQYGIPQSVKFTRPSAKYVWLTLTLTAAAEETLPADYVSEVKTRVLEYTSTLDPGEDVYLHRIEAAVAGIPGIRRATATAGVGTISTPPGSYTSSDVTIGPREYASVVESHIVVTGP